MEYWNRIRPAVKSVSMSKKVIYTIGILLFGIILGLIAKYLDGSAVNELPAWVGFTVISPLLAFICWYAKGEGKIAFVIAALIIATLFILCFSFGWLYFQPKSLPDLLLILSMAVIVRRKTMKQSLLMWAAGIALALPLHKILPFEL